MGHKCIKIHQSKVMGELGEWLLENLKLVGDSEIIRDLTESEMSLHCVSMAQCRLYWGVWLCVLL